MVLLREAEIIAAVAAGASAVFALVYVFSSKSSLPALLLAILVILVDVFFFIMYVVGRYIS